MRVFKWILRIFLLLIVAGGIYLATGGYRKHEFNYLFARLGHWKPDAWDTAPPGGFLFFGKAGVQGLREMGEACLPRLLEEYGRKGAPSDMRRRMLKVFWDMKPTFEESPAKKVVGLLLDGLKDSDHRIQWDCLRYVEQRKEIPDRIPRIASKIDNPNPADAFPERIKREAMKILMRERGQPVVSALVAIAQDGTRHPNARLTAVRMLGRLGRGGDPAGAPPEPAARQAIPALGKLIEELGARSEEPILRKNIVVTLRRIADPQAIRFLMGVLAGEGTRAKDPDTDVRILSVWALEALKDPAKTAVPALMIGLEDESEPVKLTSTSALATFASPQAVAALAKVLQDPASWEIRWRAAYALGRLGKDAQEAVRPLAKRVRDDESPWVRLHSVYALHRIGGLDGVDALGGAAAKDAEFHVRKNAVIALGELQGRKALENLGKAADKDKEKEPLIRRIAVCMIGLLQDPKSLPTLQKALHDPDKDVRANAAWSLSLFKERDSVDLLIGALTDSEVVVRREAIQSLKEIREMDVRPAELSPWGYLPEDAANLRGDAIARIKAWWDPRKNAANQDSFVFSKKSNPWAVMPLFYFQDREYLKPLIALLEDTDPILRQAAYRTLMCATDWERTEKFGYDPHGEERERRAAVQKWKEWIEAREKDLVYDVRSGREYFRYKGEEEQDTEPEP